MARKVEVVPYHSDWPEQFQAEAAHLRAVFARLMVNIYHVGSTAIPGISAKPIIDILVTVRAIDLVDPLNPALEALGYHPVGEYGIAGRRFFFKGSSDLRSHHLHAYQFDNPHILRHLAFRDYMRSHPSCARAYGQLKEELARAFPENMDSYIDGKNAFIKEHEQAALEWWQTCSHSDEGD